MRGGRRAFGRPLHLGGALAAPGLALLVALALAGCGGGTRQDAGEAARSYDVEVLKASFPSKQSVARPERMELTVKNSGSRRIPDIAITVDSFDYASNYAELADDKRPIWAIESGPGTAAKPLVNTQEVSTPGGGQTAYVNTWALGALAAHATQTFVWKVVPVKPGAHTVHYAVAAGLAGKSTAKLASGGPASGSFAVQIAGEPPITHVDPSTGKVVAGPSY